jgi:AraC family transcriptional regulator of adaptative response/methylated-DNA-[protein]-cysteine methyltransferase
MRPDTAADLRYVTGECWLGSILVAAGRGGIAAILLGNGPGQLVRDLKRRFPGAAPAEAGELAGQVAAVIRFLEAPEAGLDLPLDPRGTAFQRRVWRAVETIPAGSTASYTEVATRAGVPASARAVARACAANPLAVAIPCHRVVRADGGLSGYRWGFARKRALLRRERCA